MLNIFSKQCALTESGFGFDPGYRFDGTFNEAAIEFGHFVMTESAEMNEYFSGADEIIAEAVLSGDGYKTNILIENVFQDALKKARELWERLRKWVKGLIAKIEAFILQITGQTTKWADKMKDRIAGANPSDFKYEFHRWNQKAIEKLCDKSIGEVRHKKKLSIRVNSGSTTATSIEDALNKVKDELKNAINGKLATTYEADNKKYDGQNFKDEARRDQVKAYAEYFGIGGDFHTGGEKELKTKINKMVTGGEKVTQPVSSSDASNMLKFIEENKDRLSNIKDLYKDLKSELDKESDTLKEIQQYVDDTSVEDAFNIPAGKSASENQKTNLTTYKSAFTAQINAISAVCTMEKKLVSDIGNMATKYAKNCAFEYMSVLTAYCNASDKQKKKKS